MNVNLYGHDGQWLMVDCGVSFDEPLYANAARTYPMVTADTSFIAARKDQLVGIVLTHAHEDHLGALPYIWQQFSCPVYTTPFTAEILRRKFARLEHTGLPIVEVDTRARLDIGAFNLEWLAITHSLPEPSALVIRTSAGNVLHTADWKIDANPVLGQPFNASLFEQLSREKILAMVCDSTNATKPGHSLSEMACYQGLLTQVQKAKGRVVVTCFASNVARLLTLNRVARNANRYMALAGRSLHNMVGAARVTEHWPEDETLYPLAHMGYLPREEVLVAATGSQGDEYAAIARLANGDFRDLDLEPGDTVIFSCMIIPGNEEKIAKLVTKFAEKGVNCILPDEVLANGEQPIHASGHPCQDELTAMYQWVQPQVAVPVHGETKHMLEHANIAAKAGIRKQVVGKNGDLFRLAPQVSIVREKVKTGRVALGR